MRGRKLEGNTRVGTFGEGTVESRLPAGEALGLYGLGEARLSSRTRRALFVEGGGGLREGKRSFVKREGCENVECQ